MGSEKKVLTTAQVLNHSTTLNTASNNLKETCQKMYEIINTLKENAEFKSLIASSNYYEKITALNGQVPKFTEGVLTFSKFLSGYILENYAETDEMAKQAQNSFNEAVMALTAAGTIGAAGIDLSKISTTAQGALSGNFVSSDKINTAAFNDEGSLDFVTRDDGTVMITRNGVPIGFTTEDGVNNKVSDVAAENKVAESSKAGDINYKTDKLIPRKDWESLPEDKKYELENQGYKVDDRQEISKSLYDTIPEYEKENFKIDEQYRPVNNMNGTSGTKETASVSPEPMVDNKPKSDYSMDFDSSSNKPRSDYSLNESDMSSKPRQEYPFELGNNQTTENQSATQSVSQSIQTQTSTSNLNSEAPTENSSFSSNPQMFDAAVTPKAEYTIKNGETYPKNSEVTSSMTSNINPNTSQSTSNQISEPTTSTVDTNNKPRQEYSFDFSSTDNKPQNNFSLDNLSN